MPIIQNADSIEILYNSLNSRFYFPTDSPLAGKYINGFEIMCSNGLGQSSPTGKYLLDLADASQSFITLISDIGKPVINNTPLNTFSAGYNIVELLLKSKLSLKDCYVTIPPVANLMYPSISSLLFNFFYSTRNNNWLNSKMNVAQISIAGTSGIHNIGRQSQFIGKKIVRIEAVVNDYGTPYLNGLLTIRNFDSRIINNIPLIRLIANQKNENNIWFEPLENIDWENSFLSLFDNPTHDLSFTNPPIIPFNIYYYD